MSIRRTLLAMLVLSGCAAEAPQASGEQAISNLGCEFFVQLIDGSGTCLQDGYTGSTVAGPDRPIIVDPGRPSRPTNASGIEINYARYGWNCTHRAYTNIIWDVRAECAGESSCPFTIDTSVVGDPAPGCAKDFHVNWDCGGPAYSIAIPPEADGSTAVLSCPNG